MKCYPQADNQQDVVFQISWQCNSTLDTFASNSYGVCSVPPPAGTFTPYADLTENEVLVWCWDNGVNKIAIENANEAQIQKQINPPVVQLPLPWAT